jgi:hypothetical protein
MFFNFWVKVRTKILPQKTKEKKKKKKKPDHKTHKKENYRNFQEVTLQE